MSDDQKDEMERVQWAWVIGCVVVGLGFLGFALRRESLGIWKGVAPSIIVNLGTAFMLAGVLFWLERRFTSRVVRAGQRAVQETAEQVEGRLKQRTDELSARIADLQRQVEQRMQARAEEQDRRIVALGDDVSYDTVTTALTEANRLRAISGGQVTVQAAEDPDGVALIFKWGTHRSAVYNLGALLGRGDLTEAGTCGYEPFGLPSLSPCLEIEARIEADFEFSGGRPLFEVEWRPEDPPAAVADRLNQQLQREGRWHNPSTLDWTLALRNLQHSLELAVTSRRDGDGAGPWRLHGALHELVGEDWAITEAGIEHRQHNGVILAESDFPQTRNRRSGKPVDTWSPACPSYANADEWERLLRRGKRLFPRPSS